MAAVFRPDSYHARTDTAEEKRRLARQSLIAAGPAAVEALMAMLVHRGAANTDKAELLIQINDPRPAPLLRQLYETNSFRHPPAEIARFIEQHLGR